MHIASRIDQGMHEMCSIQLRILAVTLLIPNMIWTWFEAHVYLTSIILLLPT